MHKPLWTVQGADRETGEDRVLQIAATDEREAQDEAVRQGLFVSSITPISRKQAREIAEQPEKPPVPAASPMPVRIVGLLRHDWGTLCLVIMLGVGCGNILTWVIMAGIVVYMIGGVNAATSAAGVR